MRIVVLVCLSLLSACSESSRLKIGWVTTEPSPAIGQAIVDALAPLPIEISTYNDKNALKQALSERRIDLALLEKPETNDPNLRSLLPVYKSVLHILVRRQNNACAEGSLAQDLAQAQVFAGAKGSAGHRVLEILASSGLAPPMSQLNHLETPFGQTPDVFFVFGGILSEDALSRLKEYCLRTLDHPSQFDSGSVVEGLAIRYPQLEPFLIPRSFYPSLAQEPTVTVAIASMLVAHADVDEDLAFHIIETVSEIAPKIRNIYPLASLDLEAEQASNSASLALHPASLRFLNRGAPGFIERYAEVLAFSVTLIVALVTALAALLQYRRRSRKDRLDSYLVQLMDIRTAWENAHIDKNRAERQARQLQATVVQLLVDERVEADQALVSFLLVANNLFNDLRETP